jgi:hypothetical protein
MSTIPLKRARVQPFLQPGAQVSTGVVTEVTTDGEVFVDYAGNIGAPVKAQVLVPLDDRRIPASVGDTFALLLNEGDSNPPLILGRVSSTVPLAREPAANPSPEVQIDGQRVTLHAHTMVVLSCGLGSITLTADGKIVIKGTEIVSRASGSNKIRGGQVNIN